MVINKKIFIGIALCTVLAGCNDSSQVKLFGSVDIFSVSHTEERCYNNNPNNCNYNVFLQSPVSTYQIAVNKEDFLLLKAMKNNSASLSILKMNAVEESTVQSIIDSSCK